VWLSWLTALAPYQPIILAVTAGLLGLGLWRVYGPAARVECTDGGACAARRAPLGVRLALWLAAALVTMTASVDFLL
jgi:mercuric ion transport protein